MDVKMPEMTGIEATKRVRKNHPDIDVILFSIYDYDNYLKEGLRAGAATYVLKGLPIAELVQVIRRVYRKEDPLEEFYG